MIFTPETADAAILKELGERLAQHRLNRNLTRESLAEQSGISRSTLARLEHGRSTSVQNLIRVLRALNLVTNLDRLVPELPPSPMQQLETKKHRRQRASATRRNPEPPAPWKWGDGE